MFFEEFEDMTVENVINSITDEAGEPRMDFSKKKLSKSEIFFRVFFSVMTVFSMFMSVIMTYVVVAISFSFFLMTVPQMIAIVLAYFTLGYMWYNCYELVKGMVDYFKNGDR